MFGIRLRSTDKPHRTGLWNSIDNIRCIVEKTGLQDPRWLTPWRERHGGEVEGIVAYLLRCFRRQQLSLMQDQNPRAVLGFVEIGGGYQNRQVLILNHL